MAQPVKYDKLSQLPCLLPQKKKGAPEALTASVGKEGYLSSNAKTQNHHHLGGSARPWP